MVKRGLLVVSVALALWACGKDTVSTPDLATVTPTASGSATTASTDPTPAPTTTPPGRYDVSWQRNASWEITNHTLDTLYYTASWTDFDNQKLVRGTMDGNVASGTTGGGSFDKTCVQVDLTPLGGGKIFAFAFFDVDGKPFDPGTHPERVTACRPTPKPTPTPKTEPTPEPTPTPTPCPDPTPTPGPRACYYEVDCSLNAPGASSQVACQFLKQQRCELPPLLGAGGEWGNWFGQGPSHEQCKVTFPGYSNDHFQLVPGQSAEGCLSKH